MALTQISTGGIKDDAVTDAKLPANSVGNSEMKDDAVGVAELSASGTAGNTTFLRGDNTWATPPDTDTNTQLSTEQVQDIVGAMFTGNTETNITATYEDDDGTIDLVASAGVGGATGVDFNDDVKIRLGTGNDLEIYHDGNHSYIADTGTGQLILRSNDLRIQSTTGESGIQMLEDGAVYLYHNSNQKFETTSTGVDVTGLTDTDTLNVSSTSTFIGDMNIDGSLMHNGDTNTLIKFPAADTIGFETGGTERFRIDSGGRIITGNSSQVLDATAGTIHIDGGTSGGRLALRGTTTSASSGIGEIFAYWDTNKVAGLILQSGADTTNKDEGNLLFYTAAGSGVAERLRIDKDGSFLLGTTVSNGFKFKISDGGGYEFSVNPNDNSRNNIVNYDRANSAYVDARQTQKELHIWTGTTPAERLKIDAAGDVTVSTGNVIIGTGGKGIDFSAQSVTSESGTTTNSEVFDHYEEGSFTPFIQGTGSNNSKTYTSQYGQYTRIGNMVHCVFEIRVNNIHNADSGGVLINGFPYGHRGSTAGAYGTVAMNQCHHEDEADISFEPVSGANYFYLLESKNSHTLSNLSFGDFPQNDTFQIRASLSYPVS